MKFDKYTIIARIFPAIITLIPIIIFTTSCNIDYLNSYFNNLLQVKIVGNISISVALLYFLAQLNRFLGKYIFEKSLFREELNMPTSVFLLFSNGTFSLNYKNQIRKKIKQDFKIEMPTQDDELINLEESKRRIVEAVGLIRQKVKNGRLLLQHNIEYGFARNLVGGSIISILISIIDTIYFYIIQNNFICMISLVLAILFLFIILFNKAILNRLGNQYAKRLYQEYLEK